MKHDALAASLMAIHRLDFSCLIFLTAVTILRCAAGDASRLLDSALSAAGQRLAQALSASSLEGGTRAAPGITHPESLLYLVNAVSILAGPPGTRPPPLRSDPAGSCAALQGSQVRRLIK